MKQNQKSRNRTKDNQCNEGEEDDEYLKVRKGKRAEKKQRTK